MGKQGKDGTNNDGKDAFRGCNPWGERQWQGRDICVVRLSTEGRAKVIKAGLDSRLESARKRLAYFESLRGHEDAETLAAVACFAALQHRSGNSKDALVSLQRVIGCKSAAASHCLIV